MGPHLVALWDPPSQEARGRGATGVAEGEHGSRGVTCTPWISELQKEILMNTEMLGASRHDSNPVALLASAR